MCDWVLAHRSSLACGQNNLQLCVHMKGMNAHVNMFAMTKSNVCRAPITHVGHISITHLCRDSVTRVCRDPVTHVRHDSITQVCHDSITHECHDSVTHMCHEPILSNVRTSRLLFVFFLRTSQNASVPILHILRVETIKRKFSDKWRSQLNLTAAPLNDQLAQYRQPPPKNSNPLLNYVFRLVNFWWKQTNQVISVYFWQKQ